MMAMGLGVDFLVIIILLRLKKFKKSSQKLFISLICFCVRAPSYEYMVYLLKKVEGERRKSREKN
jgi:hypothetical protein